jgi:anti-sigma factor RsiW
MNCERWQQQFPEFLAGSLEAATAARLSAHLAECAACRDQVRAMGELWEKLGEIPAEEPSVRVRGRFYEMLDTYAEGSRPARRAGVLEMKSRTAEAPSERWRWTRWLPVAVAAAAALVVGVYVGRQLPEARAQRDEIAELRTEVFRMRQTVALALLDNQSPSDRLRGVDYSARIGQPDQRVLHALLDTLDIDPNVNVRLAAADALGRYADDPLVGERVRESLPRQQSPLVQVALLDLLAEMRDSRARPEVMRLASEPDENPAVRARARLALEQIQGTGK